MTKPVAGAAGTGGGAAYWDALAREYFARVHISVRDFHYGPLLPGDRQLGLLPPGVDGLRCLELGCGGAQNSIHLARRGADCTALDASSAMLAGARRLAAKHRQGIIFAERDMRHLSADLGTFDLIHSTFALCFLPAPEPVLAAAAALLRPGGMLLLSAPHPLWAGEWVTLDDAAEGLFLPDAFRPPDDVRRDRRGRIRSRHWPLSRWFAALTGAGLAVDRLLEPPPLPPSRHRRAPYWSEDWIAHYPRMRRIPVAVVFRALKMRGGRLT
jgi:SAM-dependent methyltransferase